MVHSIKQSVLWTHLEIGAADYGEMGAVGSNKHRIVPRRELQYETLFNTIDQLIATRGPKGVFFLNDLRKKDCEYAASKLRQHITQRYATSVDIRIRVIAKDYRTLNIKKDCNLPSIGSVHMKNPDIDQLMIDFLKRNAWIQSLLPFIENRHIELFTTYPVGGSFGPFDLSTKNCMRGGEVGFPMLRYEMAGVYRRYTYRFPPPEPSHESPLCYRIRMRFDSETPASKFANLLAIHTAPRQSTSSRR